MKHKMFIIISLLFVAFVTPVFASEDPIYTSWQNNLAVGGYDVVSYYSGVPQEGNEDLFYEYNGANWRFSTQANLDLFRTNPDAFVPQYGGYCAWAVAKDKLAKGDPEYWHVEDGKLYLNFNKRIKKRWQRDIPGFIKKGDANWPAILDE